MTDVIVLLVWFIMTIVIFSIQIYKLKVKEDGFRVTGDDLLWAIITSLFWFVFLVAYLVGLPLAWIFKKIKVMILNWLNK